jgi:Arc/MetJ-type ribon-helix-helix transcriptional regulator
MGVSTDIARRRYRTASEVIRAALRLRQAQALRNFLNDSAEVDGPTTWRNLAPSVAQEKT